MVYVVRKNMARAEIKIYYILLTGDAEILAANVDGNNTMY